MSIITKPGLFTDIPVEAYYLDCCPSPSLNQSLAKVLIEKSPAHAFALHPKLNKSYQDSDETKFDLGNCVHKIVLGRGRELAIIEADDWRTKVAKAQRDEALAAGRMPVLAEQFERANKMAAVASVRLANLGMIIPGTGASEVVLAWKEADLWFRSLVDWISGDGLIVFDFKSTKESASPNDIPRKMAADGWPVQAAFHERGLNIVAPQDAGRRRHVFACQECSPPFEMTICELPESAMTMGRKQVQYAVNLWGACMRKFGPTGAWPGYGNTVITPEYPTWAESRWLEREMSETHGSNLLMAG